jgi:DNA-binding GntR family transcriptional regulator
MHLVTENPVTASDKTFLQLRQDIVEGDILSGSKLSEAELATRYAVSRAVVREAINRLENCHLVERKPNVGARVVALGPERLVSLYQVRESLEGMAARLAATNMTDDEIDDLSGDVDFHYRIILGSKNDHLISMLIEGIYHLIRMYRVQLGMAGPRVTTAFDEHSSIARAIENRDGELAEILMRRHIFYTRNNLEQKLLEAVG